MSMYIKDCLSLYSDRQGFWMRFGKRNVGFSVQWNSHLSFSERNGYKKVWRVGKFSVRKLEGY